MVTGQQPLPQCDQVKGDDCGLQEKHALILIDWAVLEQVESFKFLGVQITNKLTWSKHTKTVVSEEGTTKPIPPQETEKIWPGSSDPQKLLQLHHREHPDRS